MPYEFTMQDETSPRKWESEASPQLPPIVFPYLYLIYDVFYLFWWEGYQDRASDTRTNSLEKLQGLTFDNPL